MHACVCVRVCVFHHLMLTIVGKVEDPRASCHSSSFPAIAYLMGLVSRSDCVRGSKYSGNNVTVSSLVHMLHNKNNNKVTVYTATCNKVTVYRVVHKCVHTHTCTRTHIHAMYASIQGRTHTECGYSLGQIQLLQSLNFLLLLCLDLFCSLTLQPRGDTRSERTSDTGTGLRSPHMPFSHAANHMENQHRGLNKTTCRVIVQKRN